MSGKIAVTLSFILLLLITTATVSAIPYIRLENFSPFMPNGWKAVGVAITMIFWSFFGWEAISNLSDQFRHPKTDIIRSTLISAVLISIVFLSLSIITVGTFSYGDMTSNLSTIGVIMNKTLGTSAQIVTALLAFIICLGTVNAFVASLGQLGYALARDHAFPRYFCHVNHRYHSPVRAIWFVIICAVTGVIISFVWSIPFSNLIFIPNSLGIIVYILSAASGLRLFHKQSLTWWLSLIAFFICLLFLPFFGVYLLVPVIVLMLYFVYIKGVSYKSTANSGIAGGKER